MSEQTRIGRVMLIDDEAVDQMFYKRVLERSGLTDEILSFTYAEKALEYLCDPATEPVDLILLDINMPRMNGFEFLEAVREKIGLSFDIPIVMMLTTSLNPKDQERAASYDVVRAYVNKPLDSDDIGMAAGILDHLRA
ncbi:MAG: response regulator [Pseudomonadota bacterium]